MQKFHATPIMDMHCVRTQEGLCEQNRAAKVVRAGGQHAFGKAREIPK